MSRKPHSKSPLSIEDFSYLPESSLPVLILGIHVPLDFFRPDSGLARDYHFKRGREWKKIAHQTAGLACHQYYFLGTILAPTDSTLEGMRVLSKKWLDSNAGCFGTSLDSINEYRADIRRLFGADCNRSYKLFEEAIYPIDVEDVRRLVSDELPSDLDELIDWDSGWERGIGCINRWTAAILGENSD